MPQQEFLRPALAQKLRSTVATNNIKPKGYTTGSESGSASSNPKFSSCAISTRITAASSSGRYTTASTSATKPIIGTMVSVKASVVRTKQNAALNTKTTNDHRNTWRSVQHTVGGGEQGSKQARAARVMFAVILP